MDFYSVTVKNGQYFLTDDVAKAAILTNEQIGLMADRLSGLLKTQKELKLALRIYITAYYSNGKTEYISLKQRPSFLISANRIKEKFGSGITLDGFAATFLDGEEENRVWFGEDGAVENRGDSQEKVKELLEMVVDGLNQPSIQEIFCTKWSIQPLDLSIVTKTAYYFRDESHLAGVLDLNHTEIGWFQADGVFVDFSNVFSVPVQRLTMPLLAKEGCFFLEFDLGNQAISLYQQCYQWEKTVEFSTLADMLEKFWQEEGIL